MKDEITDEEIIEWYAEVFRELCIDCMNAELKAIELFNLSRENHETAVVIDSEDPILKTYANNYVRQMIQVEALNSEITKIWNNSIANTFNKFLARYIDINAN